MGYVRKHTPHQGQTTGLHGGSKRAKGEGPRAGYDDKRYRDNCFRLRTTGNHICAWCGMVIDTQLRAPHPLSFSVDHIVPRSQLHPLDDRHWQLSNMQEMHRRCNSSRGDKPMPTHTARPTTTSIEW